MICLVPTSHVVLRLPWERRNSAGTQGLWPLFMCSNLPCAAFPNSACPMDFRLPLPTLCLHACVSHPSAWRERERYWFCFCFSGSNLTDTFSAKDAKTQLLAIENWADVHGNDVSSWCRQGTDTFITHVKFIPSFHWFPKVTANDILQKTDLH